MKNQVLAIDQMIELITLGVDISNASMAWWQGNNKSELHIYNKDTDEKEDWIIPAFTLFDVLALLNTFNRLVVMKYDPNEWIDIAYEKLIRQLKDA